MKQSNKPRCEKCPYCSMLHAHGQYMRSIGREEYYCNHPDLKDEQNTTKWYKFIGYRSWWREDAKFPIKTCLKNCPLKKD